MNTELAKAVLSYLIERGVCCFCVCPGGRNAPFVQVLSSLRDQSIEVLYFFEERSAGFFALGRTERDLKPTALVTTSGTAVAELLPAAIESHYSALPLVLLTADRPKEQSAVGAPQTLKAPLEIFKPWVAESLSPSLKDLSDLYQAGLNFSDPTKVETLKNPNQIGTTEPFNPHKKPSLSVHNQKPEEPPTGKIPSHNQKTKESTTESTPFQNSKLKKPTIKTPALILPNWMPETGSLHINVSFDEPLTDSNPLDFTPPAIQRRKNFSIYPHIQKSNSFEREAEEFFKLSSKPLLIAGELKAQEKSFVERALKNFQGPLYAEPLSNLSHLQNRLVSGEGILKQACNNNQIDGIIRLGGPPRVRFWRDLEKSKLPVFHLSSPPFYAGLSRPAFHHPLNKESLNSLLSFVSYKGEALKQFDKEQMEKWMDFLKNSPESEPHWIWRLRKNLPENENVFLGNSLPIRLWDLVTLSSKKHFHISGQAGVNGIEGLVSRFLGQLKPHKSHTAIIGDLSALYDLAGFWSASRAGNWRIVIINNFGGRIFSRLSSNRRFLNEHRFSFKSVAEMWGLDYELFTGTDEGPETIGNKAKLIEIRPDNKKTEHCLRAYDSLWDMP